MSLLACFGIGQRPAVLSACMWGCWTHTVPGGRSVFVRHVGREGRA